MVKDLTEDDFSLDEDGRAQIIRYFSQESDLPLTLGLLPRNIPWPRCTARSMRTCATNTVWDTRRIARRPAAATTGFG